MASHWKIDMRSRSGKPTYMYQGLAKRLP